MTTAVPDNRRVRLLARLAPCLGLAVLCWSAVPASAQLGWFGQSEVSSQDVYDTIASHGFRLAGPLMRNRDVYIADVTDRRQRRQRLIISRDTGEIIQRFMVDVGRGGAPYADVSPNYASRGRRTDDDFFSRMIHGFGEDNPPRPPSDVGTASREDAVEPPLLPRAPQKAARQRPTDLEPRVLTRREEPPITSRPLAPAPGTAAPVVPTPTPTPSAPAQTSTVPGAAATATPEKAAAPQPAASPPPTRATIVNTDPLRIPGSREPENKPATPPTTVAKSAPAGSAPASAPITPAAAPAKPAAAKPASKDVPVAPLD